MKLSIKFFFITLALISLRIISFGQDSSITKIPKFKPPEVKTFLGIRSNGDNASIDEASQLIGFPLKVIDSKKNLYPINSYHFLYKKKGTIVDEETGKTHVTFTTIADIFKTTPLPKVWVDNLKDGFQKDEELYFFDIIVKDNSGRIFYAPDLKILIQ